MIRRKKSNRQNAYNQKLLADARNRIRTAVDRFIKQNDWPEGIKQRYDQLCTIRVSGGTLYKHKDLWHPEHQNSEEVPKKISESLID